MGFAPQQVCQCPGCKLTQAVRPQGAASRHNAISGQTAGRSNQPTLWQACGSNRPHASALRVLWAACTRLATLRGMPGPMLLQSEADSR